MIRKSGYRFSGKIMRKSKEPIMSRSFSQRLQKIIARFHATFIGIFNPYRPELYYMRGPGPKWHAARARQRGR